MDVEALMVPVAPDAPAGPDLSYSPERATIEQAFERAAAGEADDIDWRETIDTIVAESLLTRDLWLAVYLARAGARSSQLAVVEDGCEMLAGLLECFWDTAHPKLDDYGIEGRKAPCESLVRIGEFIGPLRRALLIEHARLGSFSGEDFERFAREGTAATGYGQFRAAVADTPIEHLQGVIDQLQHIANALSRADAILSERAGLENQTGTNFQPTYDVLESIQAAIRPYVSLSAEVPGEPAGATPAAPLDARPDQPGRSGSDRSIGSREDVARALDAIIDYYVQREPSSPIPAALARIKGWIGMDFMAILRDISPNGVTDADSVLRARIDDDAASDM